MRVEEAYLIARRASISLHNHSNGVFGAVHVEKFFLVTRLAMGLRSQEKDDVPVDCAQQIKHAAALYIARPS